MKIPFPSLQTEVCINYGNSMKALAHTINFKLIKLQMKILTTYGRGMIIYLKHALQRSNLILQQNKEQDKGENKSFYRKSYESQQGQEDTGGAMDDPNERCPDGFEVNTS